ncbi:SGS-domain-containing protein [Aaosphaeria arxii CBS 175.79]|uniref:SGS-domain-containing protein n=1 Tax=Aaosphaeria arxii CBS 175.79 TaxID=1450172 RepID=A0A6A5Y777_9PLEO|nr:SGS-domain-containing protein [Aaosphaeria arxii CBS 175.79]KAF2021136.1 SGS-domain-containing protein [Aaosphaeria arxii CBS 175.79]
MDQAARGATALANSNYDEAIKEYTSAIGVNPSAARYYIQRSTAYQRSSRYADALADAETAAFLAYKRASRDLIKDAQLRRGIALYFTERYADAKFVLDIVRKMDDKEKSLAIWESKVSKKLEGLEEGDERGKLTAKEKPEVEDPSEKKKTASTAASSVNAVKEEKAAVAPAPVVPTPPSKIKHDWYQNNENVYFTLLAKGVPKESATVDIANTSLSISFPAPGGSEFAYSVEPLWAEIDPSQSSFTIKATKIEVTLKKAAPGIKWHALEGDSDALPATTNAADTNKSTIPLHILKSNTQDKPPAYPTSSRKGAKNWDKLAADLTKKKAKDDDTTTKGDDDDDAGVDDYEEGDETSRFFKHLYKDATPDQQRAMMKSYQESGGTVLSTDWSQVGSKTIVPEPPEGMEAKKY